MTLEKELINEARSKERELKQKALTPGNNQRYVSISLYHKKVEHQIIYDRQLSKFCKIVYLTMAGGLAKANEIILDVDKNNICELIKE